MKSLSKIFNAIYLCIRFPFLYPRNRFSDKHTVYIRWMSNLVYKYYSKSYYDISLAYKFYKDPQECTTITKQVIFKDKYNFKARLIRNNTILRFYSDILKEPYDFNIQKYVGDNFKISGITVSKSTFNNIPVLYYHIHKKEVTNTNYGFRYKKLEFVADTKSVKIYTILNYIYENIIPKICFIPTYTELNSMPIGWRKAFGIQMCKEIKQALKKHNYLYNYRIMQIKEKYGSLRWYDTGAPEEIQTIINKYEDISYHTCISCGKPAKYLSTGWICPYCEKCAPRGSKLMK